MVIALWRCAAAAAQDDFTVPGKRNWNSQRRLWRSASESATGQRLSASDKEKPHSRQNDERIRLSNPRLHGGQTHGNPNLFHYLTAIHYSARHERLLITWTLGTLVIAGPKVLEFYDDFCNHRATSLKSDGKDIVAVTMKLNVERDVDASSPNL
jgi:hypothetical protein